MEESMAFPAWKAYLTPALGALLLAAAGCGSDPTSPTLGGVPAQATQGVATAPPTPMEPLGPSEPPAVAAGADGAEPGVGAPQGMPGVPVVAPSADGAADAPMPPENGGHATLTSDECGLATGFPGDEYCILPPDPSEGFQVHIGPDDYDNIDPRYLLAAGEEITDDFVVTSTNEVDIHFFERHYRMRPGSHHMIVSTYSGAPTGFGGGRRIGTANISQDYPADGVIPPENEGVGIPLQARSTISVSLHSINVTDKPILREIWVNFYYRDSAKVTDEALQLFSIGSASFAIPPGADTVLGPYSCTVPKAGRLLWLYGHRHANNERFSAWRVRGDQRDLIYEGFDWEEVLTLEYTSLLENPVADRQSRVEGGWTGVLDLEPGDRLEWECHVVNQRDVTLRFTNETYDGEMCILDGELVGTTCDEFSGGQPTGF